VGAQVAPYNAPMNTVKTPAPDWDKIQKQGDLNYSKQAVGQGVLLIELARALVELQAELTQLRRNQHGHEEFDQYPLDPYD